MRPSSYWPLAVLVGAVIGSGVFVLVSNLASAGLTAIVCTLAAGSFLRVSFAFRERFESGGPSAEAMFERPLPWSGLSSVTASLVGLLFVTLVPFPFEQVVAIVVVLGAMLVTLSVGMGMTLTYVDPADDQESNAAESAIAD